MSDDIGSEDLGRGSVAEAFSRGCVQTCAQDAQVVLRKGLGIDVAVDPAPEPLVRILYTAFLPRGIADRRTTCGRQARPEGVPIDELRAAIEGDRAARGQGQEAQDFGNLQHDRFGAFLGASQNHENAAQPLDHRRDVCRTELLGGSAISIALIFISRERSI